MATSRCVVIGGGIAGLAAADALERAGSVEVVVIEEGAAPGGVIRSEVRDGFHVELGPFAFLSNAPATMEMIERYGLMDEVVTPSPAATRRYLVQGGELVAAPSSPGAMLSSPLLSKRALARLAAEPFVRPVATDESVFEFMRRRFGREVAEKLADPMVAGVTASDCRQTSVAAVFSRLKTMEIESKSVIRGGMAAGKQRRRDGEPKHGLRSFRSGMAALPRALAERTDCRFGVGATSLSQKAGGFTVTLSDDSTLDADSVVVATPPDVSRRLLGSARSGFSTFASVGLRALTYGFRRADVRHPLDGFGCLLPRSEGIRPLGMIFSSSLFPGHAPEGCVSVRVLMGGSLDPGAVTMPEGEAHAIAMDALRRCLGVRGEPLMSHCATWAPAIPRYDVGHRRRVATLQATMPPGLVLAGNLVAGPAVNDCIRDGARVAAEVLTNLD